MSKRNVIWLVAVIVIGVLVGVTVGIWWGVIAAAVTLVVSELVERTRRARIRSTSGVEGSPSIKDAVVHRRRR